MGKMYLGRGHRHRAVRIFPPCWLVLSIRSVTKLNEGRRKTVMSKERWSMKRTRRLKYVPQLWMQVHFKFYVARFRTFQTTLTKIRWGMRVSFIHDNQQKRRARWQTRGETREVMKP
jgi:hypothetical protein